MPARCRWHAAAILGAGLAVSALLTGCGTAAVPADGPPVVVPGRPGEPARTMPGAEAAQRRAPVPVSPADVVFVEQMIPHHRQALEMAALADARAADPQVRALAARITAVQGPEIAVLQAWLDREAPAVGPHGGHPAGHAGMPGMATPDQLDALAAVGGPEFDRLFVRLMTAHHEGALRMASDVLTAGTDIAVSELAADVTVTQTAEIDRMRAMLPS